MKETINTDLRVRRTHHAIRTAFTKMMLKKEYKDITIKDLAKMANINRKTFYLHYDSLDDLLEEIQQEIADEFVRRIAVFKGQADMARLTREFFLYSLEGDGLNQHINCDESCRFVSNRIMKKIMEQSAQDNSIEEDKYRQNIINAFLTAASMEIFRQWVADGKKIPLEEIIAFTVQLLSKGVSGIEQPLRLPPNKRDNTKIEK